MKKITLTAFIVLGTIFVNLSFGQNEKLPFSKASDKDGMFHTKTDGSPLYGSKKKPIRFKEIGEFQIVDEDTLAWVENFEKKFFHIKPNGKPAYTQKYIWVSEFVNGFSIAENSNGKFHITKNGKPLYQKVYIEVRPFNYGLAAVENEEGDSFFIDTTGSQPKSWSKEKFQDVGDFVNGCTWVEDYKNKFFFVNVYGSLVLGDNTFKSIEADPYDPAKFTAKCDSSFVTIIIKKDNTIRMVLSENPKRRKK